MLIMEAHYSNPQAAGERNDFLVRRRDSRP